MVSQGYNIPFLDATTGKICLSGDQGEQLDTLRMRNILLRFGEIYSLDTVDRGRGKGVIVCEYFDRRRSVEVIDSLHGREILVPHHRNPPIPHSLLLPTCQSVCMALCLMGKGVRLVVWMDVHPMMHLRIHRPFAPVMDSRSSSYSRVYPPYTSTMAPYYWGGMDSPRDLWPTKTQSPTSPLSRFNFFSDVDNAASPLRRRQLPISSFEISHPPEVPRSQPSPSQSSSSPGKWAATDLENYFNQMRITTPPSARQVLTKAAENISILRSMHAAADCSADKKGFQGNELEEGNGNGLNSFAPPSAETESSSGGESCSLGSNGGIPEKNRVVLEKVMMGLDKKTTIMIKNVPNKYTQVSFPGPPFFTWGFLG